MTLALYIHWPFCEAKCPYCDFNSHVRAAVDHDRWRDALLRDLRHQAAGAPNHILTSVFFGGGTPSRMHPDTTAALIEEARRLWPTANDLEITLEANPTSVEASKFATFARAGITRVSVGVQSLRDDALRALGRTHDSAQARAALDTARDHFARTSFDLIYARPYQTLADWHAELAEALTLAPDHLSLYQLTIEPGTIFARRAEAGRLPGLPDDDRTADMYLTTNAILFSHGLPAYEVSNHATPGAECRHNLAYWRAEDWLGIGPGAHGRFGTGPARTATAATRNPEAYLAHVAAHGHGIEDTTPVPDHAEDYLMTALRLAEGLSLDRLRALGLTIPSDALPDLVIEGLIAPPDTHIRPTSKGRAVADALTAYLANRALRMPENFSQSPSSSSSVA